MTTSSGIEAAVQNAVAGAVLDLEAPAAEQVRFAPEALDRVAQLYGRESRREAVLSAIRQVLSRALDDGVQPRAADESPESYEAKAKEIQRLALAASFLQERLRLIKPSLFVQADDGALTSIAQRDIDEERY